VATKVGILIDRLYKQDQTIDKIEAELRKAKKDREAIQDSLFKRFKSNSLDGAVGKLARAGIRKTNSPRIVSRPKFMRYVRLNKAWDLFANHIASKAYFDRIEDGEEIPGTEVFTKTRISVTKVNR
jgi:mannitol-1-phosphate/altronate dehydrogenase